MRNNEFLKSNLIAHRGMHNIIKGIPENSIPAFKLAIKNNYIIELDLHILKDNTVVVFHDDNLKKMTGKNKFIRNTTYEEIKDLKLKNTKYTIPKFIDVLNLVSGKVPILIELKYDTKYKLLEKEAIKILKDYKGDYAIQSFNPKTLYYFKKHAPYILRGQLYTSKIPKSKFTILINNILTKPDFISQDIKMDRINNKLLTFGWLVKNKKDLKGFDNYICENLEQL